MALTGNEPVSAANLYAILGPGGGCLRMTRMR